MHKIEIKEIIRNEWQNEEVVLVCFDVVGTTKNFLEQEPFYFSLENADLLFFWGKSTYKELITEFDVVDSRPVFQISGVEDIESNESAFLWIFLKPENPDNDGEIFHEINSIMGSLFTYHGEGISYRKRFINHVKQGKIINHSELIKNPLSFFRQPDFSKDGRNFTQHLFNSLSKCEDREKEILKLAFGRIYRGILLSGIDGLLFIWIALETFAIKGGTNIKPIKSILSQIYDQSSVHISNLEKIYSLRSSIVHEGYNVPICHVLVEYLACICSDIIHKNLNIPCLKQAEAFLQKKACEINQEIDKFLDWKKKNKGECGRT